MAQPADDDAARKADLVMANHILADLGVVDGFGHASVRSAANPGHFFISRSLAPELVSGADVVEVDAATCEAVSGQPRLYLERFIHCAVYQARPEVQAVVHNHSPGLIPFGVSGQVLRPVYHMAGFLGAGVPVFEIRSAGGAGTDMLIRSAPLGAALARRLGSGPMVLMRGHGATIVGSSLRQVVYRAVYAERNGALQAEAMKLGPVTYLNPAEALGAARTNDEQLDRPWQLWVSHLKQR
ncbi:class II aldolase/adducin family protein [Novosphingobium flavum]|uniref:Class II aldolase/adducin family protein n=2 Tax=Novosphingobium flavum TaxID=1778672 RepID=A0A7X1FQ50_9SPHN|nr:class II aldolase/adducin family protein [Novosphingobium flavum]